MHESVHSGSLPSVTEVQQVINADEEHDGAGAESERHMACSLVLHPTEYT